MAGNLFTYLVTEPFRKRQKDMALLRLSQLMHQRTRGKFDRVLVRAFRTLKPKLGFTRPLQMLDEHQISGTVSMLGERGWDILPIQLSTSDVAEITDFAKRTPAHQKRFDDDLRIPNLAQAPGKGRFFWKAEEIAACPPVQRLLSSPDLHRIAQDYLGGAPMLSQISLWLDTVNESPIDEHVFHYDNDGPKFLKFFFYLTDTDESSGAHAYIERTHTHEKTPPFHESRRYTDQELIDHFGTEKVIVFSAPAGTIIAEDTAGFHRGSTPKSRARLLMVLEYCFFDNENLTIAGARLPTRQPTPNEMDPATRVVTRKFYRAT